MNQKSQLATILAIETSCDETAVSIARCSKNSAEILSSIVSSQIKMHAKYGGVVPNLAAREHVKNIIPVLKKSLASAKVSKDAIDAIAVTNGPGLIPALLVGTSSARTLSWLWQKPLLGMHHIEGHIYANFIRTENGEGKANTTIQRTIPEKDPIRFPLLALVVSGGHTQLIFMRGHFHYEIIGETQDDAVGEAFDKVARILGLGYPGGPEVSKQAGNYTPAKASLSFPRPMLNSPDSNFSFSGLKTAVLYATQKMSASEMRERTPEICVEFQQAVIDVLIHKTLKTAKKYPPKTVVIAGGVSANTELRKQLGSAVSQNLPHTKYKIPDTKYSLDNAAMIATTAGIRWSHMNDTDRATAKHTWKTLETKANLSLP